MTYAVLMINGPHSVVQILAEKPQSFVIRSAKNDYLPYGYGMRRAPGRGEQFCPKPMVVGRFDDIVSADRALSVARAIELVPDPTLAEAEADWKRLSALAVDAKALSDNARKSVMALRNKASVAQTTAQRAAIEGDDAERQKIAG
jgi:hypothetical protein